MTLKNSQFHHSVFLKIPHNLYLCFSVHHYFICTVTVVWIKLVLSTETKYVLILVNVCIKIEGTGIFHAWVIQRVSKHTPIIKPLQALYTNWISMLNLYNNHISVFSKSYLTFNKYFVLEKHSKDTFSLKL